MTSGEQTIVVLGATAAAVAVLVFAFRKPTVVVQLPSVDDEQDDVPVARVRQSPVPQRSAGVGGGGVGFPSPSPSPPAQPAKRAAAPGVEITEPIELMGGATHVQAVSPIGDGALTLIVKVLDAASTIICSETFELLVQGGVLTQGADTRACGPNYSIRIDASGGVLAIVIHRINAGLAAVRIRASWK